MGKSCGDRCLYRSNFENYYECSPNGGDTQCFRKSQPCNGDCPSGYVLCENRCYKSDEIPASCRTTTAPTITTQGEKTTPTKEKEITSTKKEEASTKPTTSEEKTSVEEQQSSTEKTVTSSAVDEKT